MATVGYGDVSATTAYGRVVVILFIIGMHNYIYYNHRSIYIAIYHIQYILIRVYTICYKYYAIYTIIISSSIGSLVVIPTRINELQRLLSMRSPYSQPYSKSHASEKHVIVCGHVNNKQKLERFFQEFFHDDQ
mgnify:CR=1 FL=1